MVCPRGSWAVTATGKCAPRISTVWRRPAPAFSTITPAAPVADKARAILLTGRTTMQLKAPAEVTLEKLLGGIGTPAAASAGGAEAAKFLDAQTAAKPFFLTARFRPLRRPCPTPARTPRPNSTPSRRKRRRRMRRAAKTCWAPTCWIICGASRPPPRRSMSEIGALLAKVTQKKLLDNTLIILTSPCRSLVRAARACGRSGDASDPVNMYEEVVATPMIWSWAGHVVPLATRPEMVSAYDLVPTICDITPAELPAPQSLAAAAIWRWPAASRYPRSSLADHCVRAVRRHRDGAQRSLQVDRAE